MISLGAHAFLVTLPSELLSSILEYATLSGDLASLRLVNTNLNDLVIEHRDYLLQSLCLNFGISNKLLSLYLEHHNVNANSIEGLLLLTQEIKVLGETLCADEHRLGDDPRRQNQGLSNQLWFSTFTRALKIGIDPEQTLRDILAPSDTINDVMSLALTRRFQNWLRIGLTLAELESAIIAINISASKLWSSVFLYKAHESRVNTFASLSGHTLNIDQAILTEHIIWHGPRWACRLLTNPASGEGDSLERRIQLFGPWLGARADGARIAANGMARLLWNERQRKIDEEHAAKMLQQVPIVATLPINPVVWRGSSGDM